MRYHKIEDLKIECIADEEDLKLFGITMDDLLERSEKGYFFFRKIKELAGIHEKMEWTNTAYSLQIKVLGENKISVTFSETISDYIINLKQSMALADEAMRPAMEMFIEKLEKEDPDIGRKLIANFEKNVREARE